VPSPSPSPSRSLGLFCMAAAVLCFVTTGACDHLDCHRGPFLVVVVVVDDPQAMDSYLCTYSSESATWSKRVSPGFIRCAERMPSVCGECTLFWVCIVRQCSSMICNQDKSLGWNSQLDACVVSQECSQPRRVVHWELPPYVVITSSTFGSGRILVILLGGYKPESLSSRGCSLLTPSLGQLNDLMWLALRIALVSFSSGQTMSSTQFMSRPAR